jgi:hypothetical protein
MRVDSSGNVGIGTTSPSQKFHISGGKSVILSTDSGFGQFQIGNATSDGEASMAFVSGQTAFGSSPTSTNGDDYVWVIGAQIYGTGGNKFAIGNKDAGGPLLTVQSNGNVGIGTTSPATKLDVSGSIRASTGILFGTDTAAANTLSDYEEGTWTPVISGSGGSAGTFAQSGANGGGYIKIGNIYICGFFINTITDKGSWTGSVRITLPVVPGGTFEQPVRIGHHSFNGIPIVSWSGVSNRIRMSQSVSGSAVVDLNWSQLVTTAGNFITGTSIFSV